LKKNSPPVVSHFRTVLDDDSAIFFENEGIPQAIENYGFGMNQAWHAAQSEVKVQLTDRVVLSPFAAKRLAILLDTVFND